MVPNQHKYYKVAKHTIVIKTEIGIHAKSKNKNEINQEQNEITIKREDEPDGHPK